jgi:hypothetical protein
MPRTIQEIVDHADELAKRFEDYEPVDSDQTPVAEHLLRRAAWAGRQQRSVRAPPAVSQAGTSSAFIRRTRVIDERNRQC